MAKRRLPQGLTRRNSGIRIRVTVNGKSYSEEHEGPGDKAHITACVRRRNQIIELVSNGAVLSFATFGEAAQDWLNTVDVKRSTSMSYANLLNSWWMPQLEHTKLNVINARVIKRILAERDVKNKTKRNALLVLKGVLDHAEISPNPCSSIRLRKQQRPKVERYKPEEREALLGALDGQAKVFFAIMFGGGLRTGEVLALQWDDWDGERLHLSRSMTRRRIDTLKNDERRSVVIPSWVRPFINELPSRFVGGPIFINTKGAAMLDSDLMATAWRKAHKATGLEYRIPYTCRHTRAAELLSANVNPAAAAKQMGHSVEMFLRIYSEYIEAYADQQIFDTPLNRKLP